MGNIDLFVDRGPPKFAQNVLIWHGRGKLQNNIVFYPDLKDKATDQKLMRHELNDLSWRYARQIDENRIIMVES